jgi:crossover junction endodeoxyribonuclease RuvC
MKAIDERSALLNEEYDRITMTLLDHNVVLGCDPGIHGGLAIVYMDAGIPRIVDAIDIPVIGVGAKERIDVISLHSWIIRHEPCHAFIERAQAMPKQGASSGFKYGRAVGAIEAAIALCAVPLTIVEPVTWKRFHQLRGGDKEASRQLAILLFPTAHKLFARKMDHGRAESALIGLFASTISTEFPQFLRKQGASPAYPANEQTDQRSEKVAVNKMSDDEKKDPLPPAIIDDGFGGWEDGVEGDDQPQSAGIIQGSLDKFSNEQTWETRDGEPIDTSIERIAVEVVRVVQKWCDGQPIETGILAPHQKFPDIEKMNEETPKDEWVEGPDGNMHGPWQAQHVLRTVDLKMNKYSFPTGTVGGRWAIRELVDKINWMRRLKGPNIYPVIKFSRTWMNTRFGGRYRPHFEIVRWVRLGGASGGGDVEAITPAPRPLPPASAKEQLDVFTETVDTPAQTSTQTDLPLTEIKEPTLAEEMKDEIPFNDPAPDFSKEAKTANGPKASATRPTARRDLGKKSSPSKTAARSTSRRRLTNFDAG